MGELGLVGVGAWLATAVVANREELHTQAFLRFVVLRFLSENRTMGEASSAACVGVEEENAQGFAALNVGFVGGSLFLRGSGYGG